MPEMKHYVCTLMKNNVIPGEGKLDFSQEYTSAYLVQFLMSRQHIKYGISGGAQDVAVVVNSSTSSLNKYCRMRYDGSRKAKISVGWTKTVEAFKLKEGDVCKITFKDEREIPYTRRDQFAWLRMVITKLEDLQE
ncbi:uncharacterized protein [Lolium perenne]|uniref:uncharacterized protein n=1 Tax=Lolium perenne TaxID=4522 RepID=UPI003A99A9DA